MSTGVFLKVVDDDSPAALIGVQNIFTGEWYLTVRQSYEAQDRKALIKAMCRSGYLAKDSNGHWSRVPVQGKQSLLPLVTA